MGFKNPLQPSLYERRENEKEGNNEKLQRREEIPLEGHVLTMILPEEKMKGKRKRYKANFFT